MTGGLMNEIGHNRPPDAAVTAEETSRDLSRWMAEHPSIENDDQAREAKVLIDRGSLGIKDLEDERDSKVRPLNDQVKEINNYYRNPRNLLERIVDELKQRCSQFLLAKETERRRVAAEAARIAREAEEAARLAEQKEREAYSEASGGVLGVDLAARTMEADAAFADYKKAEHKSQIAERDTHIKLGGGFTRALGLRDRETLVVTDAMKAIAVLGITDDMLDAIIKGARAYRKLHGKLPTGVESVMERKV